MTTAEEALCRHAGADQSEGLANHLPTECVTDMLRHAQFSLQDMRSASEWRVFSRLAFYEKASIHINTAQSGVTLSLLTYVLQWYVRNVCFQGEVWRFNLIHSRLSVFYMVLNRCMHVLLLLVKRMSKPFAAKPAAIRVMKEFCFAWY